MPNFSLIVALTAAGLVVATLLGLRRRRRSRSADDYLTEETKNYILRVEEYRSLYPVLQKNGFVYVGGDVIHGQVEAHFRRGEAQLTLWVTHIDIAYDGDPIAMMQFQQLRANPQARLA